MSNSDNDWSQPNSDPIGDLRRYMDLARDAVTVTQIEVNEGTLGRLREQSQQDAVVPFGGLPFGAPVLTSADIPDGKARVTWSDGLVEEVPW